MAGVCRRAWGRPGQLLVFRKASFLLVFLWLTLGAECAGDAVADGEEEMPVQRNTWRNGPWKGLRVLLSEANTVELQCLGAGGDEGQTAETRQISLEHSLSPCCVLCDIAFSLWGAFFRYPRPDHLSSIPEEWSSFLNLITSRDGVLTGSLGSGELR